MSKRERRQESDSDDEGQRCEDNMLHEKIVSYVHALSGGSSNVQRSSVWMEHSYARGRGANEPGGVEKHRRREIVVRRAPLCPDCHPDPPDDRPIDVETIDREPTPPLPPYLDHSLLANGSEEGHDSAEARGGEGGSEEEDWEERVVSLAPSGIHRRLALITLRLISSLRVALSVRGGRLEREMEVRAHGRRLRRALAPLWCYSGPVQSRPAAWLQSVLQAYLPRTYRTLYEALISEVVRTVPRLAERLLAGRLPPPASDLFAPSKRAPPAEPSHDRPLLLWVPSGRERLDRRWELRLKGLIPFRRIRPQPMSARGVEAWCSAIASGAREALSSLDVSRCWLALGGVGAGASLALQLAQEWLPSNSSDGGREREGGVRALVLLSPPFVTAEGVRNSPDDLLSELRMRTLMVVGENGMQCTVGTAEEATAASGRARIVVVGGADDALRLSLHKRRLERLNQHMVDTAVAEEVSRWLLELGDGNGEGDEVESIGNGADVDTESDPSVDHHHHHHHHNHHHKRQRTENRNVMKHRPGQEQEEDYAHLPPAHTPHRSNIRSEASDRVGVVARGIGSTPLALPLPRPLSVTRRGQQKGAQPSQRTLAPADIMQLPIVFADDDNDDDARTTSTANDDRVNNADGSSECQLSVDDIDRDRSLSGYTRVIVAKRASTTVGAGGYDGGASSRCHTRPIVVRGGVRLAPAAAAALLLKRPNS